MVKKAPSAGAGERARNPHRGGGPKVTTTDPADPAQLIADLQRQLAECRAERDAGLAREAALAEVLQTTNSSPGDLTPVFDAILEKAHALCGVEHGALVTYDGEYFRMAADRGMPQFWIKQFRQPYRGSSLHERLLCGERYVQVADARAAAETLQSRLTIRAGTRTLLMVPLRKEGALRGFITAHRREVRLFSDKEIALLENFAAQAVIAMENARLLGELQARTRDLEKSLEYQTATSDVLKVISRSTFDLQPVLDTLVETAQRLCDSDTAALLIREGDVFRVVASRSLDPAYDAFARSRTFAPGRESGVSRVALTGEVVHIPDITTDPDYRFAETATLGKLRTVLGVPLLREGEPIGIISLCRQRVEPFTDRQIELVHTFADQAVIAMENARLLGELQARTRDLEESLEYQTATSDVLNVISRSTADVQPVLDTLTETAARLCAADSGTIWIREGDIYRAASSSASAADPELWAALRQRRLVPGRDSIVGRVALEGKVVHVADIRSIPDFAVPEGVAAGDRTVLGVPLLREGEVLGTIGLVRKRVQPYTERQIELVRTFADQAVIAIENARLLGELQARTRDLEESLEYQTATSEVLNVISRSTADVQPVLDTVAETATRLCGADSGNIAIREGEVYRFVSSSFNAAEPEYWAALRQRTILPGRDSIAGRVALEGRVVHIADILADPDYALPEVVKSGRRTNLGVPLLREGEVHGSINLARQRVEPFTERQIELVRTFADQAVIAIENARLLTELRESLEQQTATAEVLQVINSSPGDLQPVFEAILEKAHTHCGATRGVLFLFDGETFRGVAVHGHPQDFLEQRRRGIGVRQASLWAPLLAGAPFVQIADMRLIDDPRAREAAERGVRTSLALALRKDGALIGLITCGRGEVRPFSEKEIAFLQNFAAQAVIAMENARLLVELQARTRDLEESLEYQTATSDVLNVISRSTADVQPVLDTVAETAARLCGADRGTILVREGEGYRCVSMSTREAEPEFWAIMRQRTLVPGRDSIAGRVMLEGRVVHVPDIRADPDFAVPETVAGGNRTGLGVPLLRDSEPIGVIVLSRKRTEPFTERQIELVRTFGDQAVIAMENARLLGELQARTRDLEESLEYQTATSDVLKVISRSTFDLQPVLDTLIETAARLCGAEGGGITMREGEVYRYVSNYALDDEYWAFLRQQPLVPGRDSVAGRVALEGRVVHVADVTVDPDYALPKVVASGRRTILGVPLLWSARSISTGHEYSLSRTGRSNWFEPLPTRL